MKYLAVIGYTNDLTKLRKTINSVKAYKNNLIVIDNSLCKDYLHLFNGVKVISTRSNLTCSQMFNFMQELGREHDVDVLITMHSDIEVKEGKCEEFLKYIESLEGRNWGVVLTMHDAMAAWKMNAVDIIGPWDEIIDQYPTDADYLRRLELFGFERIVAPIAHDVFHYTSTTISRNYLMSYCNRLCNVHYNEEYYRQKWGNETFKIPFNGADLDYLYEALINNDIYRQMFSSYDTTEGAFLQNGNRESRIAQFTFLINILKSVKPKVIFETGTHKAFFTYFLTHFLEKFEIYTFDMNKSCFRNIGIIQQNFKDIDIYFTYGNTVETLSEITCKKPIDLFYVDGGHDFIPASSDILNAIRLKAKNILIDDYKVPSVKEAIDTVLKNHPNYYIIENPLNYMDDRGMVLMRKRR